MVQAYAQQLLNQKEWENDAFMAAEAEHPLVLATRRLVMALDRLEGNLSRTAEAEEERQAREGQYHEQDRDQQERLMLFEKENEALRREHDNLNAAISQLKFQYDDLHQVASTIYGKLDDSVKRLTQILEQ